MKLLVWLDSKSLDDENFESKNFEFNNKAIKESRKNNFLDKSIVGDSFSKQIKLFNKGSKDSFTTEKLNSQEEGFKHEGFEGIPIQEVSFQDESQLDYEEYRIFSL